MTAATVTSDIPSAAAVCPRSSSMVTQTICAMRNARSMASPNPVSAGNDPSFTRNGWTVTERSA